MKTYFIFSIFFLLTTTAYCKATSADAYKIQIESIHDVWSHDERYLENIGAFRVIRAQAQFQAVAEGPWALGQWENCYTRKKRNPVPGLGSRYNYLSLRETSHVELLVVEDNQIVIELLEATLLQVRDRLEHRTHGMCEIYTNVKVLFEVEFEDPRQANLIYDLWVHVAESGYFIAVPDLELEKNLRIDMVKGVPAKVRLRKFTSKNTFD